MAEAKKIPVRTCIACRQERPKREMMRVVKNADGVFLDFSGRLPGRGAYVCADSACIARLHKFHLLNKAFSCEVAEEVYARIEEEFCAK